MVTAIALGSLLAGAATTVGGVAASTAIVGSITMGQIAAGLSIASTAMSALQGFGQQSAAADAARIESQQRAAELRLQGQSERTQFAIEEAERERRLARTVAAQRAAMAGAGVDIDTGSAKRIQEETVGQINRESRIAGLKSSLTTSSLERQALGELRAGEVKAKAIKSRARQSLISDLTGVAGKGAALAKTF